MSRSLCIITGASRGLGRACAVELAKVFDGPFDFVLVARVCIRFWLSTFYYTIMGSKPLGITGFWVHAIVILSIITFALGFRIKKNCKRLKIFSKNAQNGTMVRTYLQPW